MPVYTVMSPEHGAGSIEPLMRRLEKAGIDARADDGRIETEVTAGERQAFAEALAGHILKDLKSCELSRLAVLLPVSLRERELILPLASQLADRTDHSGYAAGEITRLLDETRLLIPEGILRFRLPLVLDSWAMALDRAGEELLIDREYTELLMLLGLMTQIGGSGRVNGEVRLILHADGSCVISGGSGQRIECAEADAGELMAILAGIAPERISVYDLTGGKSIGIMHAIRAFFGERASFFISVSDGE
ncbi:MAG: hypothetical protein J5586_02515 [Clostridia bacterium]|nr:hypothetical protein [Clostridia bacterium]